MGREDVNDEKSSEVRTISKSNHVEEIQGKQKKIVNWTSSYKAL